MTDSIATHMAEAEAREIARLPASSGVRKSKVSHSSEITCAWLRKPMISSNTR